MKRKTTTTNQPTALETFETRKAAIAKKAAKFAALLEQYDRTISSTPGGHRDWGHAGTLGHVDELLTRALESLADAARISSK